MIILLLISILILVLLLLIPYYESIGDWLIKWLSPRKKQKKNKKGK